MASPQDTVAELTGHVDSHQLSLLEHLKAIFATFSTSG